MEKWLRAAGVKGKCAGLGELCEASQRPHGYIHPVPVLKTPSHFTSSKTEALDLKNDSKATGTLRKVVFPVPISAPPPPHNPQNILACDSAGFRLKTQRRKT